MIKLSRCSVKCLPKHRLVLCEGRSAPDIQKRVIYKCVTLDQKSFHANDHKKRTYIQSIETNSQLAKLTEIVCKDFEASVMGINENLHIWGKEMGVYENEPNGNYRNRCLQTLRVL